MSSFRFARAVAPTLAVAVALATALAGHAAAATVPDGWQDLVDDTSLLTVSVPPEWDDIRTSPQPVGDEGELRPTISAATDLATFRTTFDASGLSYFVVPFTEDYSDALFRYGSQGGCSTPADEAYDDGAFDGSLRHWTDCGESWDSTEIFNLVVSPETDAFTLVVFIQITDPSQRETVDAVLASFNLTHLPAELPPPASAPDATDDTSAGPRVVTDNLGGLSVEVPAGWDDQDTSPASDGYGNPVPYIAASPDLEAFRPPERQIEDFAVPGVIFRAYPRSVDLRAFVETFTQPRCTDEGIEPYDDDLFSGYRRSFADCAGTGSRAYYVIADPAENVAFTAALYVRVPADGDVDLDTILASFSYSPTVMTTVMGTVSPTSESPAGT